MKADNFIIEGYSQETREELGSNARVRSASPTLSEGRNGVDECTRGLLEDILTRDNMNRAYKRVKSNKGSHGVDGMKVGELLECLKQHGDQIRQSILAGTYSPRAVRRVEIPKPDGGVRL